MVKGYGDETRIPSVALRCCWVPQALVFCLQGQGQREDNIKHDARDGADWPGRQRDKGGGQSQVGGRTKEEEAEEPKSPRCFRGRQTAATNKTGPTATTIATAATTTVTVTTTTTITLDVIEKRMCCSCLLYTSPSPRD